VSNIAINQLINPPDQLQVPGEGVLVHLLLTLGIPVSNIAINQLINPPGQLQVPGEDVLVHLLLTLGIPVSNSNQLIKKRVGVNNSSDISD
jgi:hypothetical protein